MKRAETLFSEAVTVKSNGCTSPFLAFAPIVALLFRLAKEMRFRYVDLRRRYQDSLTIDLEIDVYGSATAPKLF